MKPTSNSTEVESAQRRAQIQAIRRIDPLVSEVVISSSHAALYVLENGASVHWRKVGIEGFFYVVRRAESPLYRILLMNQTDSGEGDFAQSLDGTVRFEVKEGTFFYQVGEAGNVRGLWFHDRDFMPTFVRTVERICSEQNLNCEGTFDREPNLHTSGKAILQMLRKDSSFSVTEEPPPNETPQRTIVDLLRKEFSTPNTQVVPPPPPVESAAITREDLRRILTDMVSSEAFVDEMFARLVSSRSNLY